MVFRGCNFRPLHGYAARSLLELHARYTIGETLNKRKWWRKWQRAAVRDQWLLEVESGWIAGVFWKSVLRWRVWWLEEAIAKLYQGPLPMETIPYNLVWRRDAWRTHGRDPVALAAHLSNERHGAFDAGNRRMESYGQIVWYFALVRHVQKLRARRAQQRQPRFELGVVDTIKRAVELVNAVHRGSVTRDRFAEAVPDGDHRRRIVDALWYHVDRILQELSAVRQCVINTIDLVIQENQLDEETVTAFICPGPVQETWMSDLLSNDRKRKFVSEVAVLENVPDGQKDWHPESNNQVLDLVHPSLYCCVFGETKCVAPSEASVEQQSAAERMQRMMFDAFDLVENRYRQSATFQWIPSEFAVSETGEVEIQSYINDLHPVQHQNLYDSIAHIFEAFVPLFDRVLSCLLIPSGPAPAIEYSKTNTRDVSEIPHRPPVPQLLPLAPDRPSFSLRGRTVQVITKIAEIHLTPENPFYRGGAWHVEGSDAEQIVATGIYYFGCDNITESRLAFCVIVQEPHYQQDDVLGMQAMYGLHRDERLVQPLAAVTAIDGRCVVFPNTLQHRVESLRPENLTAIRTQRHRHSLTLS